MRREWPVWLVLLLLLAVLAGWIGLSRYPESRAAAAAEDWPLVGPWIGELRRLYLPPAPPGPPAETAAEPAAAAEPGTAAPPPPAYPRPALPAASYAAEDRSLWIAPGDALLARPEAGAEVVAESDAFTAVPVVGRSGRWLRVRLRGREGWILPPERAPGEPPLGRAPLPPRPLPAQEPDAGRLAAARALLAGGGATGRLGPYLSYSDAGSDLLAWLGRVAAAVEPAYADRYHQLPVGEPAEAVALFERETDYRAFQDGEERLRALPAGGHASGGVVALWAGGRRRDEVASTLVHELSHLLNRRALGPALPPWLDEGIADDLGSAAIGVDGGLDPARLGGAVERDGGTVTWQGPRADLRTLAEASAAGDLPRLSTLVALDWETFVRPARRELHYPLAGFLVRYLLAGEGGALAPGFRAYLAAVAGGGPAGGEALLGHLGRSWDSLEWGFELWLIGEAAAEAGYVAGVPEEGAVSAERRTG